MERPPFAPCASARGAQTHGGDAQGRDCSGPDSQSHEEFLQCRPDQVCPGSLVHTGLRCHPFKGAGRAPSFFDPTGRRASGPSQPDRRSDRTEGTPLSLPSSGRLAARGGHAHGGEVTGRSAGPREEGRLVRIVAPQPRSRCIRPVSYTAVLLVAVETVLFRVAAACRRPLERGHSGSRRALGCCRRTVLVRAGSSTAPHWPQLAIDNVIGRSTAYR